MNKSIFSQDQSRAATYRGGGYFNQPFLRPVSDEVFIDGGCYDGSVTKEFINYCGGNYKKIFCFEPDPSNYKKARALIKNDNLKNVELIKKGMHSSKTVLRFSSTKDVRSKISEDGGIEIPVTTIDGAAGGERVTLIKMDIEGSEMEALKGARKTIKTHTPRLIISVYHKPQDILELLSYIKQLCPDYKFWLRQNYITSSETVLFAKID